MTEEKLSEVFIQVRAPARLLAAIDAEARRQMAPRSVIVRQALARELGLLPQVEKGQAQEQS